MILVLALGLTACATPTAFNTEAPPSATEPVPTLQRESMSPTTAQQQPVMPTAVPIWSPTPQPPPTTATQPMTAPPVSSISTPTVPTSGELDASLVARVNGTGISRAAYELRAAQAQIYLLKQPGLDITTPAGKEEIQHLRARVLAWMVDQVLIEQAAAAHGITVTPQQVEEQVALMRGDDATRFNQWLASNGMTLDQLREQIRNDIITSAVRDMITQSLERRVPQVHVRHILLAEESAAQQALAKLKKGTDFAAVAREFSEDASTRAKGGDLGFIPRGVMPPEFDQVAFALRPRQTSDVIRTDSGLYIVQVLEVDPSREISAELWPVVQQNAFERWLEEQRAKAEIRVADVTLP
ncbi:MAG: peptidylprolyl isomerase [Chloroflexi bacterium]|nr:peptidylprolyl isomerase [Chloroflexota bacterium]